MRSIGRVRRSTLFAGLFFLSQGIASYAWWTGFCFCELRYLTDEELCQRYRDQIENPELRAAVMGCGRVKQRRSGTLRFERYVNTKALDFPSDGVRLITLASCGEIIRK